MLSILSILVGGILAIYRVAQKYDKSISTISAETTMSINKLSYDTTLAMTNIANAVKGLTEEVIEIKSYKKDIDKNTKDIIRISNRFDLLEQRCELRKGD